MLDVNSVIIDEPQVALAESEKPKDETNLLVLKGGFSTDDGRYNFKLSSGGTGEIIYSDFIEDREEFFHEIDVEALAEEIERDVKAEIGLQSGQNELDDSDAESIREEMTSERLEEVFWEDINNRLEDPFFRSFYDDSEWGEEFSCEIGSVREFEEFLELCVLTEREISSPDDYLIVEAETEYEEAGLSECSYQTERLEKLVGIACKYFKPSGFRYDYNDGCYDRFSGYSVSSETVSISLSEASKMPAREKMLAMVKLKEKLSEMKASVEIINELTAF